MEVTRRTWGELHTFAFVLDLTFQLHSIVTGENDAMLEPMRQNEQNTADSDQGDHSKRVANRADRLGLHAVGQIKKPIERHSHRVINRAQLQRVHQWNDIWKRTKQQMSRILVEMMFTVERDRRIRDDRSHLDWRETLERSAWTEGNEQRSKESTKPDWSSTEQEDRYSWINDAYGDCSRLRSTDRSRRRRREQRTTRSNHRECIEREERAVHRTNCRHNAEVAQSDCSSCVDKRERERGTDLQIIGLLLFPSRLDEDKSTWSTNVEMKCHSG